MKNCRKWRKLIFRSREQVLSAQATKRLHEHLAGCKACSTAQDWDQAIDSILKKETALKTPVGFNSVVWTKIANNNDTVPAPFRWRLLPATAGALSMAAVALGLVLITYQSVHIIPVPQTSLITRAVTSSGTQPAERSSSIPPGEKKKSRAAIRAGGKTVVITGASPVLKPLRREETDSRSMPAKPRMVWQDSSEESGRLVGPSTVKQRVKQLVITRKSPATRLAAGSAAPAKTLSQSPVPAGIRLLKNKIHLNRAEQARWELTLDQPGRVSMKIFSREGKLVKTLLESNLSSGSYVFAWDGASEFGNKVASGIYLLVIRGVMGEERFKLVVIK